MQKNSPDAIREAFRCGAPPQVPAVLFGGGQWSVNQAGRLMREVATDADLMTEFAVRALKQYYQPLLEQRIIGLISLADHSASSDMISRKAFAKFCLPPLMDFIDWAKKSYHVDTWLHICGNTADKWDLMIDSGAICLSLDQKVDLAMAKQVCRGKVCIAGNVDPVHVMDQGGIDDVIAAAKLCMQAAGPDGFILTTGCEMTPTTPPGNVQAMMEAAL